MTRDELKEYLELKLFYSQDVNEVMDAVDAYSSASNGVKPIVSGSLPPAPTDDEIEANGIEGGLRDGELQMFWEGAVWMRSKAQWRQ